MKQIKIMLAEDHQLVREAFTCLLNDEPGIAVTGSAANGKELLELLKVDEPDLVLLDIDMPVMNGRQTLEVIKKRFPNVKVMMLSLHNEPGYINEFMANGANGYLNKNVAIETLFKAIRAVHNEGVYFNKEISDALLNGLKKEKGVHPFFDEHPLTPKELIVLKELCAGKTNKLIADVLHVSINTIDFHRGNIYIKTKCKNVADLVKYAIKNELVKV